MMRKYWIVLDKQTGILSIPWTWSQGKFQSRHRSKRGDHHDFTKYL